MKKLKVLYKKYEESITYLIFGGLTTLVNFGVMYFCEMMDMHSITVNNVIAWVVSVAFAFVTNKFFVFKSKSTSFKILAREIFDFAAARLLTGAIETAAMWLFVDEMGMNWVIIKAIMAVFVILSNYVISKLVIFRAGRSDVSVEDVESEENVY